jgi:aspartyl-tRNA(Asn)/glutamyl-tRNA(Gln) amidotransferase subunit C
MMKLDKKLLQDIATNARLDLSDKEIKQLLPQLKEILKLFSQLKTVNTKGVKPSFQPITVENVLRADTVEECLTPEAVFLRVKNRKDNYFKGPKAV